MLVIGVFVVAAANVLWRLRLVVVPVALAVLVTTFLTPPTRWLKDRGFAEAPAALTVLLAAVVIVAGLGLLLVPPVVDQFEELDIGINDGIDRVQKWLVESPLPLSHEEIASAIDRLQSQLSDSLSVIADRIVSGAVVVLEVVVGLVLTAVVVFFLLKDGARIWSWCADLAPPARRNDVRAAGDRVWQALGGYVRGQTLVALFDAILIGLALALIGVPLVLPLAVLTFFGAYVPVVGATVAGLLAVLVALVANGTVAAVVVLASILVVQQVEGNVVQPIVVGRAVHVHPLAILLGVTAGGVLAGILGALFAGPTVAVVAAILTHVRERAEPDTAASSPERDPADGRPP